MITNRTRKILIIAIKSDHNVTDESLDGDRVRHSVNDILGISMSLELFTTTKIVQCLNLVAILFSLTGKPNQND